MRRDTGSELLAALVAIGILALALVFGLVLTLSQRADAALTQAAQANGSTLTATATLSVILPDSSRQTPTVTPSLTATHTAIADSVSPSPSATATPRQIERPSTTHTQIATVTVTQLATPSRTAALTSALLTVTVTITQSATYTATHTQTATATVTVTQSATPSRTATRTATSTLTPTWTRTSTSTPSLTLTPSATATPSATLTPSHTPTPTLFVPTFPPELLTPTPTPLSVAALTATPCLPRRDWIPYTVQAGETLFSLARRAQVSLAELARANCIADPSRLVVGTVIYLPRPLDVPTPVALNGVNIRNCSDPQRRMVNVVPDGRLSGVFVIIGTAQHENFQFYKVEIRADGSDLWHNLVTRSEPINGGMLATLDTALFPADIYWLRLTVVDQTGNFPPPCEVRVILAP